MPMTRREVLRGLLGGGGLLLAGGLPGVAHAFGDASKLEIITVAYNSPRWDQRRGGLSRLAWEIMRRTSMEMRMNSRSARPDEELLFSSPLLYLWGDQAFDPWPEAWVYTLQRHLTFGGTLLVDSDGGAGDGFDQSLRRELTRVLPGQAMARLPSEHTLYKSFFLLTQQAGRILNSPYLEGIDIDDRSAVIYTRNDWGGAWERDELGAWRFDVAPGGETQRELAFRYGVNLVMYAACVNYKSDQVHIPFILKRRR